MTEPSDRQLLLSIDRRVANLEALMMRHPIPKAHSHSKLWMGLLAVATAVLSSPLWMR
jgi:hypothetical protein